jgi:hypothetical protein
MSVHSGRFALVNGQSTNAGWSINDTAAPAEAVASNTAFAKARRRGVREWSGSFNMFGHQPFAMPGASFSFSGYTAPENDGFGLGLIYSGTALVNQLAVTWDWATGALISSQVDFVGHLALTTAQGAPPLDASVPVLEAIAISAGITCKDITKADVLYTAIPNVTNAVLTITNAIQEYVNSSTIVSGDLWKGRKAGTIDWAVAITQQDNIRTQVAVADQVALKMFVDATTFWDLQYGIVKDFTGIQINRQTGAIIQQTINIDMDAVNINTGALGQIVQPNGTLFWPINQS